MGQAHVLPMVRRAWQYSKPPLDVQVGNRRENTFALQARLPRATTNLRRVAVGTKRKRGSAYMHARAMRAVCMRCASGPPQAEEI